MQKSLGQKTMCFVFNGDEGLVTMGCFTDKE